MHSIIIDIRYNLSWRSRLLTEITTSLVWVCWFWLLAQSWIPTISFSLVSAAQGLFFLLCISAFFILFKFFLEYVDNKTDSYAFRHGFLTIDYAKYFKVTEEALLAAQNARVCTVHHDVTSNIINIVI